MPSQPESQPPRCVLCSMCCPMGAEMDPLGHVSSVFPLDLGYGQGACVRGLTAGRLLRAENRIYEASCEGDAANVQEALEALSEALSEYEASEVGLLLDVNRPLELLSAAAGLEGWRRALAVAPEDDAFVRAGCGACPPVENLADCDVVVAVGDPFSTHPVIAHAVRDMQKAGRKNRLLCIDTAPGRTARGADQTIFVHPAKLAALLCAAAIEMRRKKVKDALDGATPGAICEQAGLDMDEVHAVVGAIQEADSPAVIVSGTAGRYAHAGAALRAAMEMASAAKTDFYPLTVSPNAAAAPALIEDFGYVSQAELLESIADGELKALVVVGADLANMFPRDVMEAAAEKLDLLAWAGSLHDRRMEVLSDLVLPVALPWEEQGSVVVPGGESEQAAAWAEPPHGVPTAQELLGALAEKTGAGEVDADSAEDITNLSGTDVPVEQEIDGTVLEVADAEEGEAVLVGLSEPYAYMGGISLMAASWQGRVAAGEQAVLTAAAAGPFEEIDGRVVTLSGGGEVTLPGVVRDGSECRVVAAPAHRSDVRGLLKWQVEDGRIAVDPKVVTISV